MSSMEDNPFEYKPLKKRKISGGDKSGNAKRSQSQSIKKKTRCPRVTPNKSQPKKNAATTFFPRNAPQATSTPISSIQKPATPRPTSPEYDESTRCPTCQMPLKLLNRNTSASVHAAACIEVNFAKLPPCPNKEDCDNTIPSHYNRFNHFNLAKKIEREDSQKKVENDVEVDLFDQIVEDQLNSNEEVEEDMFAEEEIQLNQQDKGQSNKVDSNITENQVENEPNSSKFNGANNRNSPIDVKAQADSDDIELRVTIKSPVKDITMRIPRKNIMDTPIRISGTIGTPTPSNENTQKVSQDEAKKRFDAIFARKKADMELAEEAKRKGFIGPPLEKYEIRQCPFYKKIPNTSFCVDAFSYGSIPGIKKYFLSHFHYDHYNGLTKHFNSIIVCSEITSRLVQLKIKVPAKQIRALPLDQSVLIDNVEVTLLDANHCPGAVMFLFKLTSGKCILHCGDFRAVPEMEEIPALWNCSVDTVYLDTTYCKPEYDFPSQNEVISQTVSLVQKHILSYPKTLIVVGSYTIGKERVFISIAEELNSRIWASTEKTKILRTLQEPVLERRLTSDAKTAQLHVMEMKRIKNRGDLQQYLELFNGKFNHILTIAPTGWTHSPGISSEASLANIKIKTHRNISQLDVPYSEHSSFSELRRFVKYLKLFSADQVIPTVHVGNANTRNEMKRLFQQWITEGPTIPNRANNSDISRFFNYS